MDTFIKKDPENESEQEKEIEIIQISSDEESDNTPSQETLAANSIKMELEKISNQTRKISELLNELSNHFSQLNKETKKILELKNKETFSPVFFKSRASHTLLEVKHDAQEDVQEKDFFKKTKAKLEKINIRLAELNQLIEKKCSEIPHLREFYNELENLEKITTYCNSIK